MVYPNYRTQVQRDASRRHVTRRELRERAAQPAVPAENTGAAGAFQRFALDWLDWVSETVSGTSANSATGRVQAGLRAQRQTLTQTPAGAQTLVRGRRRDPMYQAMMAMVSRVVWQVACQWQPSLERAIGQATQAQSLAGELRELYGSQAPLAQRLEQLLAWASRAHQSLMPHATQQTLDPFVPFLRWMRQVVGLTGRLTRARGQQSTMAMLAELLEHTDSLLAAPVIQAQWAEQVGAVRAVVTTLTQLLRLVQGVQALPDDAAFGDYLAALTGAQGLAGLMPVLGPWLALAQTVSARIGEMVQVAQELQTLPAWPDNGGPIEKVAWLMDVLGHAQIQPYLDTWVPATIQPTVRWAQQIQAFPADQALGAQARWLLDTAQGAPGLAGTPVALFAQALGQTLAGDAASRALSATLLALTDPQASWTQVAQTVVQGLRANLESTHVVAGVTAVAQLIPGGGAYVDLARRALDSYGAMPEEKNWQSISQWLLASVPGVPYAGEALSVLKTYGEYQKLPAGQSWTQTVTWLAHQAQQAVPQTRAAYQAYLNICLGWEVVQACRQGTPEAIGARLQGVVGVLRQINAAYGHDYLTRLIDFVPLLPALHEARTLMQTQSSPEDSWLDWANALFDTLAASSHPQLVALREQVMQQIEQRLAEGLLAGVNVLGQVWATARDPLVFPGAEGAVVPDPAQRATPAGLTEDAFMAMGTTGAQIARGEGGEEAGGPDVGAMADASNDGSMDETPLPVLELANCEVIEGIGDDGMAGPASWDVLALAGTSALALGAGGMVYALYRSYMSSPSSPSNPSHASQPDTSHMTPQGTAIPLLPMSSGEVEAAAHTPLVVSGTQNRRQKRAGVRAHGWPLGLAMLSAVAMIGGAGALGYRRYAQRPSVRDPGGAEPQQADRQADSLTRRTRETGTVEPGTVYPAFSPTLREPFDRYLANLLREHAGQGEARGEPWTLSSQIPVSALKRGAAQDTTRVTRPFTLADIALGFHLAQLTHDYWDIRVDWPAGFPAALSRSAVRSAPALYQQLLESGRRRPLTGGAMRTLLIAIVHSLLHARLWQIQRQSTGSAHAARHEAIKRVFRGETTPAQIRLNGQIRPTEFAIPLAVSGQWLVMDIRSGHPFTVQGQTQGQTPASGPTRTPDQLPQQTGSDSAPLSPLRHLAAVMLQPMLATTRDNPSAQYTAILDALSSLPREDESDSPEPSADELKRKTRLDSEEQARFDRLLPGGRAKRESGMANHSRHRRANVVETHLAKNDAVQGPISQRKADAATEQNSSPVLVNRFVNVNSLRDASARKVAQMHIGMINAVQGPGQRDDAPVTVGDPEPASGLDPQATKTLYLDWLKDLTTQPTASPDTPAAALERQRDYAEIFARMGNQWQFQEDLTLAIGQQRRRRKDKKLVSQPLPKGQARVEAMRQYLASLGQENRLLTDRQVLALANRLLDPDDVLYQGEAAFRLSQLEAIHFYVGQQARDLERADDPAQADDATTAITRELYKAHHTGVFGPAAVWDSYRKSYADRADAPVTVFRSRNEIRGRDLTAYYQQFNDYTNQHLPADAAAYVQAEAVTVSGMDQLDLERPVKCIIEVEIDYIQLTPKHTAPAPPQTVELKRTAPGPLRLFQAESGRIYVASAMGGFLRIASMAPVLSRPLQLINGKVRLEDEVSLDDLETLLWQGNSPLQKIPHKKDSMKLRESDRPKGAFKALDRHLHEMQEQALRQYIDVARQAGLDKTIFEHMLGLVPFLDVIKRDMYDPHYEPTWRELAWDLVDLMVTVIALGYPLWRLTSTGIAALTAALATPQLATTGGIRRLTGSALRAFLLEVVRPHMIQAGRTIGSEAVTFMVPPVGWAQGAVALTQGVRRGVRALMDTPVPGVSLPVMKQGPVLGKLPAPPANDQAYASKLIVYSNHPEFRQGYATYEDVRIEGITDETPAHELVEKFVLDTADPVQTLSTRQRGALSRRIEVARKRELLASAQVAANRYGTILKKNSVHTLTGSQSAILAAAGASDKGRCLPLSVCMALALDRNRAQAWMQYLHTEAARIGTAGAGGTGIFSELAYLHGVSLAGYTTELGRFTIGETVRMLQSSTGPVFLLMETTRHAMLVGRSMQDGRLTFHFYDPNIGLADYAQVGDLKQAMKGTIGQPSVMQQYGAHRPTDGTGGPFLLRTISLEKLRLTEVRAGTAGKRTLQQVMNAVPASKGPDTSQEIRPVDAVDSRTQTDDRRGGGLSREQPQPLPLNVPPPHHTPYKVPATLAAYYPPAVATDHWDRLEAILEDYRIAVNGGHQDFIRGYNSPDLVDIPDNPDINGLIRRYWTIQQWTTERGACFRRIWDLVHSQVQIRNQEMLGLLGKQAVRVEPISALHAPGKIQSGGGISIAMAIALSQPARVDSGVGLARTLSDPLDTTGISQLVKHRDFTAVPNPERHHDFLINMKRPLRRDATNPDDTAGDLRADHDYWLSDDIVTLLGQTTQSRYFLVHGAKHSLMVGVHVGGRSGYALRPREYFVVLPEVGLARFDSREAFGSAMLDILSSKSGRDFYGLGGRPLPEGYRLSMIDVEGLPAPVPAPVPGPATPQPAISTLRQRVSELAPAPPVAGNATAPRDPPVTGATWPVHLYEAGQIGKYDLGDFYRFAPTAKAQADAVDTVVFSAHGSYWDELELPVQSGTVYSYLQPDGFVLTATGIDEVLVKRYRPFIEVDGSRYRQGSNPLHVYGAPDITADFRGITDAYWAKHSRVASAMSADEFRAMMRDVKVPDTYGDRPKVLALLAADRTNSQRIYQQADSPKIYTGTSERSRVKNYSHERFHEQEQDIARHLKANANARGGIKADVVIPKFEMARPSRYAQSILAGLSPRERELALRHYKLMLDMRPTTEDMYASLARASLDRSNRRYTRVIHMFCRCEQIARTDAMGNVINQPVARPKRDTPTENPVNTQKTASAVAMAAVYALTATFEQRGEAESDDEVFGRYQYKSGELEMIHAWFFECPEGTFPQALQPEQAPVPTAGS
ncbi:hypothetical protein [Paraburkholderia aspalathi]|uniref:hypothetical protein n=1 Tax=Paraburkholderia aspalathi TaxID=1324617 RepID=UPI0038B7F492